MNSINTNTIESLKLNIYNQVVNAVMQIDKNSSLDTLLQEANNNLDVAIYYLSLVLERNVQDEDSAKEEHIFYCVQLAKLKEVIM